MVVLYLPVSPFHPLGNQMAGNHRANPAMITHSIAISSSSWKLSRQLFMKFGQKVETEKKPGQEGWGWRGNRQSWLRQLSGEPRSHGFLLVLIITTSLKIIMMIVTKMMEIIMERYLCHSAWNRGWRGEWGGEEEGRTRCCSPERKLLQGLIFTVLN